MALSTHTGGAANKAGHYHESLWGVDAFLAVLYGEASEIRIETPGDDGAEFHLVRGSVREHWQAKRQVTRQNTWTIHALGAVLTFFFEKFRAGDRCVFASVSNAPELKILSENARAASGFQEFCEHFLNNKEHRKTFCELQQHLGSPDQEEVFRFLSAVTVRNMDEVSLEMELGRVLGATFQGPWQKAMAVLRDLYLCSTHERLTAADIRRHLETCGVKWRRAAAPGVRDRIAATTQTYVEGQHAKLIRGTAIRRAVADEILARLQAATEPVDVLVSSSAGGGKSACLCQIVEGLQAARMPVLAFRLDGVDPRPTPIALGEALGLGESPGRVLADAYPGQPVTLVADQLDCVSTTSGRHPNFFDTIAALRDEVLGLRPRTRIHLVMACRKFDFEHDHRLKTLLPKGQAPVELGKFTLNEVATVLASEGGELARLSPHQQAMLRLPQNLALFVSAGLASTENRFTTAKELCDAYWEAKQKAVTADFPEFHAYWHPAISHLAKALSDRQALSLPAREMDRFPPAFLERMVSEGVLSRDGQRFGFGHETFFDYCFARTQPNGGRDFVRFLEGDAQHLFRRAQLRQVLAFLRDDDFAAYVETVDYLLRSDRIRAHLKLLTVELVAAHPNARDEELQVLMPWIESELACGRTAQPKLDRLASRVLDSFFSSRAFFVVADRLGYIRQWLRSDEPWLLNTMGHYLRRQMDWHAERVAELLEPFAGKGEDWRNRLRYVMAGRGFGKSRRSFDLFLRLLDDGAFDATGDQLAVNDTFWSMLHGFAEEHPDWCAELAAHWLDRQITIAKTATRSGESPGLLLDDNFGVEDLFTSAREAPAAFLQHVLPAVLRAAEAFKYASDGPLARDGVWSCRLGGEHISMSQAFPTACETAFELIGRQSPDSLRPYIGRLRLSTLHTANLLLMNAYLAGSLVFADEALALLAAEPERFRCGYTDSPYWLSRQIIEKCSPHCTEATFRALEATVLTFVPPYERTEHGMPRRGQAAFNLASALAANRRSKHAGTQIAGWQHKFGNPSGPPRGVQTFTVASPIPSDSARHMTDEQWLRAIAKYNSGVRRRDYEHPERGGAWELAGMLQDFVKEQPERFAALALRFPDDTEPSYFKHVLFGLKEAAVPSDMKLQVARRVFRQDDTGCLCAALDMLGEIGGVRLPDDAIQFIQGAARHPDPESELPDAERPYCGHDILTDGINTVRGHAAEAIRSLIRGDPGYLTVFSQTLDRLVADPSLAVRSVVASTLFAVARHDTRLALGLMARLLDTDDRLLGTAYVVEFIQAGLREHFTHLASTIERMLRSSHDEVRKQGGILACLARLYHQSADYLAEGALSGDEPCRLGVCEVARSNLLDPECRGWCEPVLVRMFRDDSKAVRTQAAGCFHRLWQAPDRPLTDCEPLIRDFLDSPAFAEEPTYLLHALEDTKRRVPEIALDVCERFATRCADQARDIRTSLAADEHIVGKLVFTVYAQLQSQPLQTRSLDLIDRMSLEGLRSTTTHLVEFER